MSSRQASSESRCRDSQPEDQAEEGPLTSSQPQPTLLLNSFLELFSVERLPPVGCSSFFQIETHVNGLGILLPLLQGQDPTSHGKKLRAGFIFSFSTKQVSGMHYSNLQFIFKPFFFNGYSENIRF